MPPRASGHLSVGVGSGVLGAVLLAAGVWRVGPFQGSVAATPMWAVALTAGSVLALAGGLIVVFALRPQEEAPSVVPAHVAFHSRMAATADVLVPATPPRLFSQAPARQLPVPERPAQQRVPPARDDLTSIDTQIRELTRRINKAGVMLATGQLSQQGYLAYVDDIKRQRASLEAQRVRVELKG